MTPFPQSPRRHVCNGEILGVSLLMEDVLLSEESQLPTNADTDTERVGSAGVSSQHSLVRMSSADSRLRRGVEPKASGDDRSRPPSMQSKPVLSPAVSMMGMSPIPLTLDVGQNKERELSSPGEQSKVFYLYFAKKSDEYPWAIQI